MAVTSLWRVKGYIGKVVLYTMNPEKTTTTETFNTGSMENNTQSSLDGIINYVERDNATNQKSLVSGIMCHKDTVVKDMMAIKNKFSKPDGVIAYHGYQSFAEGEVTPDDAHEIGKALAKELWGDRFQVLITTHLDKESHIHNHFVINTVSFVDGKKFFRSNKDYYRMREVSVRLCKEYGLSIIENPEEKGNNYGEWLANKEGRPTLRDSIREAIDIAIRGSTTEQEFLDAMDELGYIIDQSGKYPKIKHIGTKRFVRFNSLGEGYTVDQILDRVYANYYPEYPDLPRQDSPQKIFENENGTVASFGYFAVYHCYFNALKITKERPNENRAVYLLVHQDHNKMRDYSDGVKLLAEHKLNSKDEILEYKQEALNRIPEIEALRNEMRNALRRAKRANDLTLMSKIRYNIDIYTRQLNKLRREVGSCDYVIERANEVKEKLQRIKQQKFKGKEMINDEHISRSSRPDRENES